MNTTANIHTWKIRELAKVTEEEAQELREVIDNEYLVDWSEATNYDIRMAIKYAKHFMAHGWSAPA